ncbi:MAG TPA: GDP-mannose 4,6-dehydratase, partial [Gemmatimonadaceae bacterium]|nr:GDP-mannose 4,6-dehydratase [Gemmatimonadaceae bacterium]
PGTIRAVLRGERPVIRSNGTLVRDYLYVEDAAATYTLLAEHLASNSALRGEAFNFSNELRMSVSDMVQQILELMGKGTLFDMRCDAANEIQHQYLSAERAQRVLGWAPMFSLEEGLKRTIAWYAAFLSQSNT